MSKEVVLSTHIEKTGGTSLSAWFTEVYGDERVLIYNPATDTFLRGNEVLELDPLKDRLKAILTLTPFMAIAAQRARAYKSGSERHHVILNGSQPDFDVVHGHFNASRYVGQLNDPFTSVVLRDPLERMKSHYVSWRRRRGNTNQRLNIPYDSDVSFRDFSMLPQMQDFQAQALGGMSIEDFDLVGTTEKMDHFTGEFFRRRGIEGEAPHLPNFNKTLLQPSDDGLGIDGEFMRAFREVHSRDYELYARALDQG